MDRIVDKDGVLGGAEIEMKIETPERAETGAAPVDVSMLEAHIYDAIAMVYDPEIPVNIYELGLIYNVAIDAAGNVVIDMTLTSPACPVAGSLPGEVEMRVREVGGVSDVKVELVWDPPWTPDRMTEAERLQLGFM